MKSSKVIRAFSLLTLSYLAAQPVQAAQVEAEAPTITLTRPQFGEDQQDDEISAWSLNVDNDLLTGGGRDRDYTGGFALSVTGSRTRKWLFSLDKIREQLTNITGLPRLIEREPTSLARHTMEFGFTLFTPGDITISEPILDDHPYASLFFIANAAQYVLPEKKLSYQSVFTLGALGLPLADNIQGGIHSVIGSELPEGWDNQISAGGEPTARYTLSVQKTLIEGGGPGLSTQFTLNSEANIGFTTDASVGIGFRLGRLSRPWYTFNPHPAEYISVGTPPQFNEESKGPREMFFYAGVNVKYRLYNAIVQGQFRDSDVAFDTDEINPVVAEGWAGFLTEITRGYRFGIFIRGRTAELDIDGTASPVWGGFVVSRSL